MIVTIENGRTLRSTLARLLTVLALLGLTAWLSYLGMLAVHDLGDVEVSENVFLTWAILGWLGLLVALPLGALAVIVSRPSGPRAVGGRHKGLGRLGVLFLVAALVELGLAGLGGGIAPVGLVLLAVGVAALVKQSRKTRRERGGE